MAAPGSKKHRRHHLRPIKSPKIDGVRNEINVTPLVDVCLVLLIIFMVVVPLMERGREVELPQTRHHVRDKDTLQPIVVIEREGTLFVDKEKVPNTQVMGERIKQAWQDLENLNTRLKKKDNEREGEGRVLVKAHPEAFYGKVYPVIMALHELGATGIDLGTKELKEK
jgi:biopolymer transport protein ExbD